MRTREELKLGIAELLRGLREKRGISKNRMAEYIGVNKHTWYAWESGETCPSAADLISIFEHCNEPMLRPVLNMLYPDTFGAMTEKSDINAQRRAVSDFFLNDASDRMIRVWLYLFGGDHGSEIAPQVEEFCALDHLPLEYRYLIGEQIYVLYMMSMNRGDLVATDCIMPEMGIWTHGLKEGQKAAFARLRSYSTTAARTK